MSLLLHGLLFPCCTYGLSLVLRDPRHGWGAMKQAHIQYHSFENALEFLFDKVAVVFCIIGFDFSAETTDITLGQLLLFFLRSMKSILKIQCATTQEFIAGKYSPDREE